MVIFKKQPSGRKFLFLILSMDNFILNHAHFQLRGLATAIKFSLKGLLISSNYYEVPENYVCDAYTMIEHV